MSFDAGSLLSTLATLERRAPAPGRYVVAFSGGLDSSVLLHVLAESREQHGKPLLAVHVDHRLHADSARWRETCAEAARTLDVDFSAEIVEVDPRAGGGLEAAARDARYAALARHVGDGDWLLSAHHQDDQAETLLLNLLRGSGPIGLAGIGRVRRFAAGWLVRPLIDTPRAALEAYAESVKLRWLDDPANAEQRFDRNYLRHEILPRLNARWPGVVARLARSAALSGDAASLLDQLAAIDLESVGEGPGRLSLDALSELSRSRQRNVLRRAMRQAGLPAPSAAQLTVILDELPAARKDAQPAVRWPGGVARRYREGLYLFPADETEDVPAASLDFSAARVELGHGLGSLVRVPGAPLGLSDEVLDRRLEIRFRRGGESIRPRGQTHTRRLKALLQEAGIVPWMRQRLPLVYADDELVAVADLWLAASASSAPGTALEWHDHPPLY